MKFQIVASALTACLSIGVLAAPVASAAPLKLASVDYVVKDGDFLFGIARKLGAPLADLLAVNGMTATSVLHPGQHLAVPASATNPGATAAAAAAPKLAALDVTYTVKKDDFFAAIARKLGAPLADLLAVNGMTVTSMLHPGQLLAVPASATKPTAAAVVVTAASNSANPTYTVQPGDYLFGIARTYNIKLGTLLKLNGLTATSVVLPGRSLLLPAGSVASVPAAPVVSPTASKIDTVLAFARAQLGKPYRFNTAGPDTFDCSGLTAAAYAQVGLWLPHQSAMQANRGAAVDWRTDDIQAGDLVFMFTNDHPTVISHVGIAINSWQWIHAPRPGDMVRIGLIPSDDTIQAVRRYVTA
jgi:cell wall-associated NlpC family hydrolase